ncbi:MAG: hypothetical protein SGPRY_010846, partial [Prymnesium sp.]
SAFIHAEAVTARAATFSIRFSQLMRLKREVPLVGAISISEMFGHASFMLAGTAFLDPDILGLRILSVMAGSATLIFTYWHPVGKPLWIPFGWNIVFIVINGGRIYEILSERRKADQLPEQAVEVWRSVFAAHGVEKPLFAKLLETGTWVTFRKGATLLEEGQPSNSVMLVVRGGADVFFEGQYAKGLSDRQFIGEMGLVRTPTISLVQNMADTDLIVHCRLTIFHHPHRMPLHSTALVDPILPPVQANGLAVSSPMKGVARVVTNQQTTCIVWRRHNLHELMKAHPEIKNGMQAAISADTFRNLQHQTSHADPGVVHRMWLARYSSVLSALLAPGEINETQRAQVRTTRRTHEVC